MVVTASPGDAVTGAALDLRGLLRRAAPSDVFARYVHPSLDDDVFLLDRWAARSATTRSDLVIFHASIGEPDVFAFLGEHARRLMVVYHNISPPEAFAPYDRRFSQLLAEGRAEVAALARRAVAAVAVSEYNAAELGAYGYRNVKVAPLPVDPARLTSVTPDPATAAAAAALPGPVVLFVGQVLPHKRPELLVAGGHVAATWLDAEARLVVVGAHRLPPYSRALTTYADELNVADRVVWAGHVDDTVLAAWYRRADVFVTASEHEGFCAPLVEAMAFDVPVVARAFAAIPETLAGAGVLLDRNDGAAVLAEAAMHLAGGGPGTDAVVAAGRRRLASVDPDRARAELLAAVMETA